MNLRNLPSDSRHRLLALTRHLARNCEHQDRVFARALGLTSTQWHVLAELWDNQEMLMSELAEELMISRSTATRLVDTLEKKGFVRRKLGRSDRRQQQARLTPKGEAIYHEVLADALEGQRSILSALKPLEREAVLASLEALGKALARLHRKLEDPEG